MSRFIFFLALTLLLVSGVPAFAAAVPSDGTTDSSLPADAGMQSTPAEVKPEAQAGSMPTAELASSSPTGSVEPRPVPAAEVAGPQPAAIPSVTVTAEDRTPTAESLPKSPGESTISPWMWLVGLLAVAGGSVYGAYSLMKASQPKGEQASNTCDAIQEKLDGKQYELSLAEHEFSYYEETLQVLEKKALEKAESEKNKIVKKIEGTAKDVLLGKKNESDARAAFDAGEKALDTYEDIQKKIKKGKEILEALRGKRDELRTESNALQASYVACVANLPDAAKSLATGGVQLAVPNNRPIRAIVFDWAGVLATEAFWIWSRKNEVDMTPIMEVDMKVNAGEMPHEEFVALVAKVSGKTSAEVWAGVKAEMILNADLIALIRELKKKYKIGLLSNFTAPWLREVLDENKLWDLFDEHIISSEHGIVKPDTKIFKKMLLMLDMPAGEVVFADDRDVNVNAAKKLGLRPFLFTDVAQFTKDLKSVGVSVKP